MHPLFLFVVHGYDLFVCQYGSRSMEELLKTELEALGADACKVVQGGVHFAGDKRLMYRSLLWSRLASRILMPMGSSAFIATWTSILALTRWTGRRCSV